MEFNLDPPHGVDPVRIGMMREDARVALAEIGDPVAFRRGVGDAPGWEVARSATVFVYCDDAGHVNAIEFATPGHGVEAEDRVLFKGVDLFAMPVVEVLDRLQALGAEMISLEAGYTYQDDDRVLSLWRDGGPVADDGMPKYWEAALIAAPGYYV